MTTHNMMCETSQTSFLPHPSRAPFSKFLFNIRSHLQFRI